MTEMTPCNPMAAKQPNPQGFSSASLNSAQFKKSPLYGKRNPQVRENNTRKHHRKVDADLRNFTLESK